MLDRISDIAPEDIATHMGDHDSDIGPYQNVGPVVWLVEQPAPSEISLGIG